MRLLRDLRAHAERTAPAGVTVLATLTAPIRLPGRTADAMREAMDGLGRDGDYVAEVNGNAVRLRLIGVRSDHKLIGFVHNPSQDPTQLLDLAERWLRR